MKWISAKNYFPEEEKYVLVVCLCANYIHNGISDEVKTITIGAYDGQKWHEYSDDTETIIVTHWMPLPKLPRK